LDLGSNVNTLSRVRAEVDVMLGDNDAAITALDKALAASTGRSVSVPLLKLDPMWDPIRNDPRFQALLEKYSSDAPTQDAPRQ
jgi:serine/threonine-protein kinase